MKVKYLKFRRWLLLGLLGLMGIGVSSCAKYGSPEDDYSAEYGCPVTEYNDTIIP